MLMATYHIPSGSRCDADGQKTRKKLDWIKMGTREAFVVALILVKISCPHRRARALPISAIVGLSQKDHCSFQPKNRVLNKRHVFF
jgi:hypothetical protein